MINPGQSMIDQGHLQMHLDGVFWSTPLWLLRFRVGIVILVLVYALINMCFEWTVFWESITKLKFFELWFIWLYFLSASFLRPRVHWYVNIARCYLFFLVVLQVTIIVYWVWNFLFPLNEKMQSDIF